LSPTFRSASAAVLASNAGESQQDVKSPGDEHVLVPVNVESGGGGMGRWDISYWFKVPDPVPAEVALAVTWLDAGIQPTVLRIARDDILKATPEELSFPR
jgi:hypothetical protein